MTRRSQGILVIALLGLFAFATPAHAAGPALESPEKQLPRPPSIWRQPVAVPSDIPGAVPLDTPDTKYRLYFDQVKDKIMRKWHYPRSAGERRVEGEALVEIRIAKDGSLESAIVHRSSGNGSLDDAALDAVKAAEPFPPVPDDVATKTLAISGTFRYSLGK